MCPAFRTDTDVLRTSEDAYERFILQHLKHYGLFTGRETTLDSVQGGLSSHRKWRGERFHHSPLIVNRLSPDDRDSNPEEGEGEDEEEEGEEEEGEEEEGEEEEEEEEVQAPGGRSFSLHLGKALRSRQLVIEFDGERPVPRLREPPDLCALHASSSPFHGVRWPVECEVIKEPAIHHIEWDPPVPEPFYQPTGHERAPLSVGDEKGNVVYCIEPATKCSYFTCSRVGGSRGPVKSAASCGSTLAFESRFESGNLQKAVQVGLHDYELTLRADMYTTKHTQWFYFQVRNMSAGVNYRFTIVNLMKASSLYGLGMRPLLYSERAAREKGVGWTRTGSNIRYYRNQQQVEQDSDGGTKPLHSLTWTCQFPHDSDTCYLAHCYPYTYSQLQRYLSRLTSDPATAAYCKLRILCRSLAGNTVHVLTVTSPGGGWAERQARRAVVVTARVHPGETNGSWMMQGFLDFLLGPSDDARLLRDTFVFKVVPMLNPDGVVVGNYRCSLAGRDLNRNYRTLLRDSFPCVWHTRNMVKRLMAERDVVLYCDFHGHSRKNNVFMYGCDNRHDTSLRLHERVFPLMMSKNANDKFSFRSCKFRVQKSKEGTGRIVMWRLGVRNSYTMESTFGGSTLGNRKGTHFTTRDLKSLGYYFCDTLLDYCDPDPTKTSHCLAELGALLRQEVKLRLGRDLDSDGSLCSVSVSDIESSTSGSNSTESDGLPVHLLNRPTEPIPVKKKHLLSRKERNLLRQKRHRSAEPKTLHRNTKHMEPVPAQEEEATGKSQDKTMAALRERQRREKVPFIVRVRQSGRTWVPHRPTEVGVIGHVTLWQGDEPEKDDDLKASTAADLCKRSRKQARQPITHTDERSQPSQETLNPPPPGPRRHLLTVTALQQRGPSIPIPTCKVRIHTTTVQQQPMPFGPTGPQPGMRGRHPAHTSAAHRSAPEVQGLQCRVVPEFVPSRGLEATRSFSIYPAKSHSQWTRCGERQGQAARGHIRYSLPEAPSSTDTLDPRCRSPNRDSIAGPPVDVSETGPLREQEQTAGASSLENLLSKTGTFLPDLRTMDLTGRSRPLGDQSEVETQRTGPSKRDLLKGGVIRRVSGGEYVTTGRYRQHRLAQQTLQEEEQDAGELPQVPLAAPSPKEQPAGLQRDNVRRLQKLSLAKTSRLPSTERGAGAEPESGPGTRMVQGPERGVNSRPTPPCSNAPLN